jgi:hypothetical protein
MPVNLLTGIFYAKRLNNVKIEAESKKRPKKINSF